MDLTKTLSYNYVFRGLPKHVVSGFAALAQIRELRGGDVLVRQFEKADELIIVLEGTARIRSYKGDALAEFGPGSIIGEMALIDEQPRSATVTCVGSCKVAVIPASVIRGMMSIDSRVEALINGNLCRVLVRRLRTMNARLESTAPMPQVHAYAAR